MLDHRKKAHLMLPSNYRYYYGRPPVGPLPLSSPLSPPGAGGLCLVIAIILYFLHGLSNGPATPFHGWVEAPGTILSADLVPDTVDHFPERPMLKLEFDEIPVWRPEITYEYVVDGQRLSGEKITNRRLMDLRDGPTYTGGSLDEIMERYHPGASTTVIHHPSSPGAAFLFLDDRDQVPALRWLSYGFGGIGLMIFGVGLLLRLLR